MRPAHSITADFGRRANIGRRTPLLPRLFRLTISIGNGYSPFPGTSRRKNPKLRAKSRNGAPRQRDRRFDRIGFKPISTFHRLLYFSRAQPDVIANLDRVFPEILADAIKRNTEADITGALLAVDGWFLQALEGPHVNVVATFKRISNDKRHSSVTLIKAEPMRGRSFGTWTMCGRSLSPTDNAILDALGRRRTFHPNLLGATKALELLHSVVKIQTSAW